MAQTNSDKFEEKTETITGACEQYADKLWDNESDEELSAHIATCEACRIEAEKIARIKEALNTLYTPDGSLSAKLDEALEKAPQKKKGFKIPQYFGTAVAAVLIVFVMGISGVFTRFDIFTTKESRSENAPSVDGNYLSDMESERAISEKSEGQAMYEAEEENPACDPSFSADQIKNNGFNYITVKGITKDKLVSTLKKNNIGINTDVTVSSEQIAIEEKDMEKAEKLLKSAGAVIVTSSGGSNAGFTLIEIKK